MAKSISALTLAQYRALVAGIPLYCPNAIFTVASQTFTAPQAVTFINAVLAAVSATATAKGAWKDAMLAEEKLLAADGATVKVIRNNIADMFSNAMNTLEAFEIAPRKKPAPLTADARAAATAKARATRLARGTASKKAKAVITGNVTGVTIVPDDLGTLQGKTRGLVDPTEAGRDDSTRVSQHVERAGRGSRAVLTSAERLTSAIVDAVGRGLDDVARALAAQLAMRQREAVGANVVPLAGRVRRT